MRCQGSLNRPRGRARALGRGHSSIERRMPGRAARASVSSMATIGHLDQPAALPLPLTSVLADWATLAASVPPASADAFAQALLRASEPLSDHLLRRLPATPDEAAASMREQPFGDRVA